MLRYLSAITNLFDDLIRLVDGMVCPLRPALTGFSDSGSPAKCLRNENGKITAKGDWCAATNGAATVSCGDAVRLEAAFAASAVKISDNCP